MNKNDDKFIKRGKLIILVFGVLSLINIIILIGRNPSYALFRRTVSSKRIIEIHTPSEFPSKEGKAVDIIKATLGKKRGIVGVTTSNEKTIDEESNDIREYRYSGVEVNNYVYFNCLDNINEQNSDNCEIWRIIGIFKDDTGQEHIKIVRNSTSTTMVWNGNSPFSNSWTVSHVKTYLNETYLTSLSSTAQNMIEFSKLHFGAIATYPNGDTTKVAYTKERNGSILTAQIALMYPSDYGFSVSDIYWDTGMDNYNSEESATSWLQVTANHSEDEWLLSPSSNSDSRATYWGGNGHVSGVYTGTSSSIRAAIYLKSNTQIIGGTGTFENPYKLSFIPMAVDVLKETMGQTKGIIGVTTSAEKTIDEGAIDLKEYRYSGASVNNYVYFNCSDTTIEQNADGCETWRIIGIFKEDNGNEHMKIVRNSVLSSAMKWDSDSSCSSYYENCNPSWISSTAAVRIYLNGSYLKSLSSKAQNMIDDAKWYLGETITAGGGGETTRTAYSKERSGSVWTGKIALMYATDYGFSVSDSYWNVLLSKYDQGAKDTSWIYKTANHSGTEWFISPYASGYDHVAYFFSGGYVNGGSAGYSHDVRPTLYLKSNVTITSGTGESGSPYQLAIKEG